MHVSGAELDAEGRQRAEKLVNCGTTHTDTHTHTERERERERERPLLVGWSALIVVYGRDLYWILKSSVWAPTTASRRLIWFTKCPHLEWSMTNHSPRPECAGEAKHIDRRTLVTSLFVTFNSLNLRIFLQTEFENQFIIHSSQQISFAVSWCQCLSWFFVFCPTIAHIKASVWLRWKWRSRK